jgi:hypothetical protein
MSEQWKPGDVALAQYDAETGPMVYLRVRNHLNGAETWQSQRGTVSHAFEAADWHRLLVPIDTEDRALIERLLRVQVGAYAGCPGALNITDAQIDNMQGALRSLTKPLKPEEPTGLGAVIEVPSTRGDWRVRLVRGHATHQPWMGDTVKRDWSEIEGPIEVLSEGVPS